MFLFLFHVVAIEYKLILDAEKDEPRLFFHDDQGVNIKTKRVNLQVDSEYCASIYAYVHVSIIRWLFH